MLIELRSGKTTKQALIRDDISVEVLDGRVPETVSDSVLEDALACPVGSPRLRDIVRPGERIVIMTSDVSRPMPTAAVLPALLEELYSAGVKDEDMVIVFATGSHRGLTPEERESLVGADVYRRIRCVDSDPSDCVHLGETAKGTPVDITRVVAEADRRICLGNIDFHYFAGYSGGVKALMPGVSTYEAIQKNHSMMLDDRASVGNVIDNPIRLDLEEALDYCPVDFMLNVILGHNKEVIAAVAGDVIKAHRKGCEIYDRYYRAKISRKADIVIASQGGAPKDLNLYQMQKALDNAQYAAAEGGTIILVGSCNEGLGNKVFEEWVSAAEKPQDLIDRIQIEFRLGGHKAAAIAMVRQKYGIKLVSDMDPETAKKVFMEPYNDLQCAIDDALEQYGSGAKVTVIPYAGSTLPVIG